MSFTRQDIQDLSDLRLIGMAVRHRIARDPRRAEIGAAMTRLIKDCEALILDGPREFHHIVERVPSAAAIESELHHAVFGRRREAMI